MKRKQAGSIVIISSMSSQIVNHPLTQCFYNPSKAAVSSLYLFSLYAVIFRGADKHIVANAWHPNGRLTTCVLHSYAH